MIPKNNGCANWMDPFIVFPGIRIRYTHQRSPKNRDFLKDQSSFSLMTCTRIHWCVYIYIYIYYIPSGKSHRYWKIVNGKDDIPYYPIYEMENWKQPFLKDISSI